MRKIALLVLIFFSTLVKQAFAQQSFHFKPDYNSGKAELIGQYNSLKDDTSRLKALNNIVFYYPLVEGPDDIDTLYLNKLIALDQSIKLVDVNPYLTLRKALRIDVKSNSKGMLLLLKKAVDEFDGQNTQIPALLTEMRYVFSISNDHMGRYQYYSAKLIYYLERSSNNNAAACYHCLAGYYVFENDLNQAINYYLKAAEAFEPFSNLWYAHDLGVVGYIYALWGNNNKAKFYLQKALKLEERFKTTDDIDNLYDNLANVEYQQKNYLASLNYLDKVSNVVSTSTSRIANLKRSELNVLKALNFIGLNNLAEAEKQLQLLKKLPPLSEIDQLSGRMDNSPDFGLYKYYLAVKDPPKAEIHLLACYHTAVKYTRVQEQIRFSKMLQDFYGEQNNTANAWKYTLLYNKLQDSLQNRMREFNVASYESEQKETVQNKKLVQLQQQHAVQEATIGQRNTIIWISLAGLIAVLASLVFINRQLRINKRNLNNLKTTQTQLIQSEKMASLGELTAGIAHEIQNPLNFVNNFSEVSAELVDEMDEELDKGDITEAKTIGADLKQNLEKIHHHGKRADAIVKGMLEHSRVGTGEKEPTDLNALTDEFLKLSYHGLRAKDKSFNAELTMHLDEKLPKPVVSQQDIGRVLLNLFNNAFYAVNQRSKTAGLDYKPVVEVTTSSKNGAIEIKVKDNGNGIPEAIKDKIMQPFFTTKPTGEGTGLGLSLTYDIVVKGHRGSITLDSKEGEGSAFIVKLPLNTL